MGFVNTNRALPNKRLKLAGDDRSSCRALASREELRSLAARPLSLPLRRLAPARIAPAA